MENKEYVLLIDEKREEIQEVGEKAYTDACNNTHLYFSVVLHNNGEVEYRTYTNVNDTCSAVFNNEAIEVMRLHENPLDLYEPNNEMDEDEYVQWYIDNYRYYDVDYKIDECLNRLLNM